MESNEFYAKKLEGLELIKVKLAEINRLYNDLVALEDAQPCGDSYEEYAHLSVILDDLRDCVEDRVGSTWAMVEMSRTPPKPTASEVHAVYVSSLR